MSQKFKVKMKDFDDVEVEAPIIDVDLNGVLTAKYNDTVVAKFAPGTWLYISRVED